MQETTHNKQDLALVPTLSEALHEPGEPSTVRQAAVNDETPFPLLCDSGTYLLQEGRFRMEQGRGSFWRVREILRSLGE